MIKTHRAAAHAMHALFAALLAVLLAAPLTAQSDGGPPPGGPPPDGMDQSGPPRGPSVERDLKRLTKLLALTPDQQAQVKIVLTDRNQKFGELMRGMRPPGADPSNQQGPPSEEQMEQVRTQMKAIQDGTNARISALLNPEQAAKFQVWLKQQRQRGNDDGMMPPPPPDGGPGGPPSF